MMLIFLIGMDVIFILLSFFVMAVLSAFGLDINLKVVGSLQIAFVVGSVFMYFLIFAFNITVYDENEKKVISVPFHTVIDNVVMKGDYEWFKTNPFKEDPNPHPINNMVIIVNKEMFGDGK